MTCSLKPAPKKISKWSRTSTTKQVIMRKKQPYHLFCGSVTVGKSVIVRKNMLTTCDWEISQVSDIETSVIVRICKLTTCDCENFAWYT